MEPPRSHFSMITRPTWSYLKCVVPESSVMVVSRPWPWPPETQWLES